MNRDEMIREMDAYDDSPMDKPNQQQSVGVSLQAADLRARLRSQEDEIDALMELWDTLLPIEWLPGRRQFLIWLRRYGFPMVEKGITVAADKLHQVTKEAKRPWTANDAIRYASGVMARSQEELDQMAQAQGLAAARLKEVNGPEASQTTTVSEKNDV